MIDFLSQDGILLKMLRLCMASGFRLEIGQAQHYICFVYRYANWSAGEKGLSIAQLLYAEIYHFYIKHMCHIVYIIDD